MGFLVLIILTGVGIAIVASSSSGNKTYSGYRGGYVRNYDEEDYENYETSAARGDRDYFSDDSAHDYDSYYAQVADLANMGDQDTIDEMRGEFGDGEVL